MAKSTSTDAPVAAAPAAAEAPAVKLSLTDFCIRLSETVRRPEMIGAFESVERRAGRVQATEAEFRARYGEFVKKPV